VIAYFIFEERILTVMIRTNIERILTIKIPVQAKALSVTKNNPAFLSDYFTMWVEQSLVIS
jgi:hypothetical protein